MRTGQFVKGMIDGYIKDYESDGIGELLSPEELDKLWNLGKTRGIGIHTYINEDEGVVAKSIVTETSDGAGRKGTRNHTIIVKKDTNEEILACIDQAFKKLQRDGVKLRNPLPIVKL